MRVNKGIDETRHSTNCNIEFLIANQHIMVELWNKNFHLQTLINRVYRLRFGLGDVVVKEQP